MKSLAQKQQRRAAYMPEVNEEALLKLIKITVFLIRQHQADAKNYEDLLNLWILHLKRIHWKNNCIFLKHIEMPRICLLT